MLHAIGVASLPSPLIAAATSAHLSALRLEITTLAPARAIASAIARPMPLVEPVITATFPVRSNKEFDIHLPPLVGARYVIVRITLPCVFRSASALNAATASAKG